MSHSNAYMAILENIYFSAFPTGNFNFESVFKETMQSSIQNLKDRSFKEDVFIKDSIEVINGISRYPYGFYVHEKVRIYFANSWTDNYPIYIIVSAQFLHTEKVSTVLDFCTSCIKDIVNYFAPKITISNINFKLSRIDICNHTTKVNMNKYIKVDEYFSRVSTRLSKVFPVIEKSGEGKQEVSYFRYGKGDFVVRFYNKTKEVMEQKYKPFFIQKWYDVGLIDYDTKLIYEYIYRLNSNYRLDFLFANIVHCSKLSDDLILDIVRIYNNPKLESIDKIEMLSTFIKDNNIILVKEITNVEFQVRSGFLKTIRIINKETGEFYNFTDIDVVISHLDVLYHYLTNDLFRVVDRKSKAKRIRDRKTDSIWMEIQLCNVENIDSNVKILNAEIYREYNNYMNKYITVKSCLSSMAHLTYLLSDDFNNSKVDNISINCLTDNVITESSMNENFYNIRYLMQKQIKMYGVKGNEDLENKEVIETKEVDLSYINKDYIRNMIYEIRLKKEKRYTAMRNRISND